MEGRAAGLDMISPLMQGVEVVNVELIIGVVSVAGVVVAQFFSSDWSVQSYTPSQC